MTLHSLMDSNGGEEIYADEDEIVDEDDEEEDEPIDRQRYIIIRIYIYIYIYIMMKPHIKVFGSAVYPIHALCAIWSPIYTRTTIGLVSQQNRKEVSNPQDMHCLDFEDYKCETSQ